MHQSHVIEVSGRFAGAAMTQGGAFRFVAVDPRAAPLDRSLWPSLPDVQRAVTQLMQTGCVSYVPAGRAVTRPDDEAGTGL